MGPFRVPIYAYPATWDHIYHTHNKFFMVDERVFYVASQNLYPSAIGNGVQENGFDIAIELNEYGFLVDDDDLAEEVKAGYWDQTNDWLNSDFHTQHLSDGDLQCVNGVAQHVVAVELVGWDVVGQGDGEIKATWETATELGTSHFNIYRNTSPDMATWE